MRATWFEDDPAPRRPTFKPRMPQSVVGVLIVVNVIVFLLQTILASSSSGDVLARYLALDCYKLASGTFFLHLYQFFTYQFLHGGLLHIFMNMIVLWFFGRELEPRLGSGRFLFLYLAGGVVGGVVFLIWGAFREMLVPVVGASGAIYGIVVFYAMLWPHRKVNVFLFPFMIPMKVMYMAMIFVGFSLFYGFFAGGGEETGRAEGAGVAHFCHLGGALFGYLFYRYEQRLRTMIDQAREWKKERDINAEEERQEEVDRLLAKIHEEGISSLTPKERSFLNETSRKLRNRK